MKATKYFFFAILTALALFSCSDDQTDSTSETYPRKVTIEYRLTGPSSTTIDALHYFNESGGVSTVENQGVLPYSKKITKIVEQYETIGFSANCSGTGTLKAEIIVDDVVVNSQDFSESGGAILPNITYVFN